MMIPSLKQILIFLILNFLLTTFFNILLFQIPVFLTYESFNTNLILNSDKIGMFSVSIYTYSLARLAVLLPGF